MFSLGVILYQMLFGRRPFGEGQSQVGDQLHSFWSITCMQREELLAFEPHQVACAAGLCRPADLHRAPWLRTRSCGMA